MASPGHVNLSAFEQVIEQQKANLAAASKAQIDKMTSATAATQPHATALLSRFLVLPTSTASTSAGTTSALHSPAEFSNTMAALRTYYFAAPAGEPKPFQLPLHLSQPVTLTREGTAATTSLIVQFHRELIIAVQTHTEAVFEALKAYGQSQNPTVLHKQLESIGAAWKAEVNSTIDRGINQALAAGQQHVDQQAALAGFMHGFGELIAGVGQAVTGAIQGAAHAVANAAKVVGGAIASAAKDVGNAASGVVTSIGHFFGL